MNMLGNNSSSHDHNHHHHHLHHHQQQQQQQLVVDQNETPPGDDHGGGGGGDGVQLKKGPWTAAEDGVLTEYVRKHGEGNWNAVQRNTGLARCGKSCRLRWANHLRPNLKKGAFSPDEERLIVELHAQLGNKWARMAAQLPGRTDNEIKNYWNTRVKRRHRQGLPLYPPEIQAQQHHRQHHHHHQQQQQQQQTPQSSHSHQSPVSTPSTPTSSNFSFHTTPTNHSSSTPTTPTSANHHHHHHLHHLQHYSRSPTPNCLSPTPPPPLSPSPSSGLHSPHQHQHQHPNLPTLSLFDSTTTTTTTTNPINMSTGCSKTSSYSPFNVHRAPPLLQAPLRFKRFHADTTTPATTSTDTNTNTTNYNDHTNNNFNTNTYQNTSFSLPFSTFLRTPTSLSDQPPPPQPNCNINFSNNNRLMSLQQQQQHPYASNNMFSFGSNTSSSSSSILRTQFDKDHYGSSSSTCTTTTNNNNNLSNSSVFALKPELPSSQHQLYHNGSSAELAFLDIMDNDQKLSLSGGGSGLLEDLLDETTHVTSMEDKRGDHFSGFNHWSDSTSSLNISPGMMKPKEEITGAEQINTMHEDLSKLFNVINPASSMQVPAEWYNDTGEASNGPSSVVTDDNISLEMQQIASMFRVDSSTEHVNTHGSCSLDNLPRIC